jgi:hypothetical protein
MLMIDQRFPHSLVAGPNDAAVSGVIYNYGMTMFLIQVLEHQLVNLIVASNLPRRDNIPRDELVRIKEKAFSQTMGTQLRGLVECVDMPSHLREKLDRIVLERNRLAHHFFRDHYEELRSVSSNENLCCQLSDLQHFIVAVDDELTQLKRSIWRENGMEHPF